MIVSNLRTFHQKLRNLKFQIFKLLLLVLSAVTVSSECNKCEKFSIFGGESYYACVEYNAYKACSMVNGSMEAVRESIHCRKGSICSVKNLNHPCIPRALEKQTCHPEVWSIDFCRQEHYFHDPSDSTCQKYIKCVRAPESFKLENFTCFDGEQFSEKLQKCVATKVIITTFTTESTTTTTDKSTPSSTANARTTVSHEQVIEPPMVFRGTTVRWPWPIFHCKETGVFQHPSDKTCTVYVSCTFDIFKSLKGFRQTCPRGTQFNSAKGKCDEKRQPGCPVITKVERLCKRNGFIKDPDDKTCAQFLECEYRELTGTYRIIKNVCPVFQQFSVSKGECTRMQQKHCPPIKWCHFSGKFPDPDDLTCRRYVRCMEDFKSLYGEVVECEGSTQFDRKLETCTNVQQDGCPPVMGVFA